MQWVYREQKQIRVTFGFFASFIRNKLILEIVHIRPKLTLMYAS